MLEYYFFMIRQVFNFNTTLTKQILSNLEEDEPIPCNERDSYSLNIVCLTYVYVMCMVTAEKGNFVVSLVPEIL